MEQLRQEKPSSKRAGQYVRQAADYRAFIPKPLPPEPPLAWDDQLLTLLSTADQSLGRLDGVADTLPNPDLFVGMYVRKEAVLSSQIEGTQASLVDVLEYEANVGQQRLPSDVRETFNYVQALHTGLERLNELPLCNRLLREIHGILMQGVRGQERTPGEFRTSQNWIGPPGSNLNNASYVPPPPHEMTQAIGDLEHYLNSVAPTPLLIKAGLAHAQFELIHPFLDGNGRLGRLLITFLLCHHRALTRPLLYLSSWFKQHQDEYYSRLYSVSHYGDWEGWLKYFLQGVGQVSQEAVETARRIIALREEHRQLVDDKVRSQSGLALLDALYETPLVTVNEIRDQLKVSYGTASNLTKDFVQAGILQEIFTEARTKTKIFSYNPYLSLLNQEP